jgi:SagB-type dehydrogenase family enzyme
MRLPKPRMNGGVSLEKAIKERRTVRSFTSRPLTLEQYGQILWAAQGVTGERGFKRTAPSAGALYPMDLYSVVGEGGVGTLKAGIYHYGPEDHTISLLSEGDLRSEVAAASLSQMWIARAPINLVITAEYDRVTIKYGRRGLRYAMIEAGHIGQNIFLQAEALLLAAGIVGAFSDEEIKKAMKIPSSHDPILVMPVGYKT